MFQLNANNPQQNAIIIYISIIIILHIMKPEFLYINYSSKNKEINLYKIILIAISIYFIFFIASYKN
jgi:hypothetical protein